MREHVASQLSEILAGNPFLSHLIQNTEACCLTADWDQMKLYQNIGNRKLFKSNDIDKHLSNQLIGKCVCVCVCVCVWVGGWLGGNGERGDTHTYTNQK